MIAARARRNLRSMQRRSTAPTSIISLSAAKGAGIDPSHDGTKSAGKVTGLAGNPIDVWVATFGTFTLGDESVRNVKLQIADMFTSDTQETTGSHIRQQVGGLPEMLVGADFFRTHRILVLFAERKLVFTYNGGPIFQTIESDAGAQTGGSPDVGKAEPNDTLYQFASSGDYDPSPDLQRIQATGGT